MWLLSSQCGCVKHNRDCREGHANRGRARDVEAPVSQTQEQTTSTVKEIPQEIDVEKLMDEDVDEMILETNVDGDAMHSGADHGRSPILKSPKRPLKLRTAFQWSESWNESESDTVTDRHGVPRRRLHRDSGGGTAHDGDFYSHERPVCP